MTAEIISFHSLAAQGEQRGQLRRAEQAVLDHGLEAQLIYDAVDVTNQPAISLTPNAKRATLTILPYNYNPAYQEAVSLLQVRDIKAYFYANTWPKDGSLKLYIENHSLPNCPDIAITISQPLNHSPISPVETENVSFGREALVVTPSKAHYYSFNLEVSGKSVPFFHFYVEQGHKTENNITYPHVSAIVLKPFKLPYYKGRS